MENNFYKIVQTIENGKEKLAVIAASWEKNGKLMWPSFFHRMQHSFEKSPLTVPPGTGKGVWKQHECIVKRSHIPTYIEARKVLCEMSDQSDTNNSDGECFKVRRSAGARKMLSNPDTNRNNFNEVWYYNIRVFLFILFLFMFFFQLNCRTSSNSSQQIQHSTMTY